MPTVRLASSLARWLTPVPEAVSKERVLELPGATIREVTEHLFAAYPHLRSYVVDERGTLRHHVVIFVDSVATADKRNLADPVRPDGEVAIFQALSGG